ncbi:MAG: PolC-type DNA polymerase III [Lachnospiraceae bacterium]|nr:PolC-type DNA polymerase III [Lachnospiraceae bacterium]
MLFFEAFENFNVNKELTQLFAEVTVDRITATKGSRSMNVYISSKRLISFSQIKTMEYQMLKNLFSGALSVLKIIPKFHLNDSYTPEKLLPIYRESICEELSMENHLDSIIFKRADISFDGDTMIMDCADEKVIFERRNILKEKLENIFNERCGFKIEVMFKFHKPKVVVEEEEEEFMKMPVAAVAHVEATEAATDSPAGAEEASNTTANASSKATVTRYGKKNNNATTYANRKKYRKLPDDPDIIYKFPFEGDVIPIETIQEEIGEVVIHGKIISTESRELKSGKVMYSFNVTDFTDTILVKLFEDPDRLEELEGNLKKGVFVKLKGNASLDRFSSDITISRVVGIKKIPDFTVERMDESKRKRVELHAHTLMSEMDAVVDVQTLIKRAKKWGHKAVAITDHGVVQAFPEANHAIDKDDDFKIIYGMEGYFVDDLKEVVENVKGQSIHDSFVVFDIETTGFSPIDNKIIEIGAVKVENGKITDRFSTFVNPDVPIPFRIEMLTKINDSMVRNAPFIDTVLPEFLAFCEGSVLVAHNATFDVSFIRAKAKELSIETDFTVVDTLGLSHVLLPHLGKFTLDRVAKELNVILDGHHRAVNDAECTAEIFLHFIKMLVEKGCNSLEEVRALCKSSVDAVLKGRTYHGIILAKNDIGRINLYKLVSMSHLTYYQRRPRIPKSLLEENREGLIIGSACEAGELYQAILSKKSDDEIVRIVNFYDYLEIQPNGNNEFMIREDKFEDIESNKDLEEINKKIVALGEAYNKPVVATCDVHFLDPEDEIYRRIIMKGKGFSDADMQPPLYLRTTEEMLKEFSYLGKEKAEEVVITNTNLIADMVEKISPVRPDKCPPVIENSAEDLRKICYDKATSMYGEKLPEIVEARLEKELKSIIGNGFAVMYIIAQKLVWKSNEDGYLVGSRGSVGSSFVATMSGITEINPLPAHYYCKKCHYSDFDSEEVKSFAGRSGCDMPDKNCPVCGEPLEKDGHEIPFETFLGFYGDKEPDIDLNFSGEYQNHAHDYTEIIFGDGQTFRAGTIGGVAEKTAYAYVYKYFEEKEIKKRRAEMERISEGCVGVKRTTGQHPGGIIVLPLGEEIYTFTPVQHPANDMTTQTVTTHFDYHSIDHNLLKLDILGHDDPTMIRMLEDLTGVDAKTIRMDDQKVLSLFKDLSALGITPDDLDGCDLGSLGIPEFGTDFVMQMLRDTKPQNFSDLVRISGLSHGTDVWLNNAQFFIARGDCTLSTAICTRDDIMTFLIHSGVENGAAFKIMESVRKGKGLKPDMEEAMKAAGVPEWYLESCRRIKYMFPKAHAAAYVMMALRIAWFKVYYPLAYYAAYFGIRASAFNYELMCLGKERLKMHMEDYKSRKDTLTNKEQDTFKDMKLVLEMYARGFEFEPIDIYKAKANTFQIVGNKLMPSLCSIDGMGEKAAQGLEEAALDGEFFSQDDLKQRAKLSQTVVDKMAELGLLKGLPISNQMSVLDFL